jgi:sporulation protein YlmC with PRC-barrel domain
MSARIVPLARLNDARLPESEPDPRGFEVYGSDGVRIGEVDDLLVDADSHVVRYLDVDRDRSGLGAGASGEEPARDEDGEVMAREVAAGLGASPPAARTVTLTGAHGLGPMAEHLVRETLSDTENEMTGGAPRFPRSRHVLFPVELARIESGERRVSVLDLRSGDVDLLPEYGGTEIEDEENLALRRRYGLEQEAHVG